MASLPKKYREIMLFILVFVVVMIFYQEISGWLDYLHNFIFQGPVDTFPDNRW